MEYMISQTENAISHIEVFTEQLSKELSVLDGVIKYKKKLRKCNVDQTAEMYFILINYPVYFRQSFANLDEG